jgi:hypothetical protein
MMFVFRLGGFYALAKSGVDIVSLLQALSIPEYYLGTAFYDCLVEPDI